MTIEREDGLDYEQFESVCNKILTNMAGLGIHDIADATWRDYYNDGLSPLNAVNCAIMDSTDDELREFIHG
jgi:hypothetical protein